MGQNANGNSPIYVHAALRMSAPASATTIKVSLGLLIDRVTFRSYNLAHTLRGHAAFKVSCVRQLRFSFRSSWANRILAHPWSERQPMELHYVAQQLEKAGHTVYCPLLSGHTGGSETLGASRWQDWYVSVEKA